MLFIQEHDRVEMVARSLIDVMQADRGKYPVEHSEKSSCFKVKTSDLSKLPYSDNNWIFLMTNLGCFPASLSKDLKGLKSISSIFEGKRGGRVSFFPPWVPNPPVPLYGRDGKISFSILSSPLFLIQVAILSETALTEKSIKELHALCCQYDRWCRLRLDEESQKLEAYGDKFYTRAASHK